MSIHLYAKIDDRYGEITLQIRVNSTDLRNILGTGGLVSQNGITTLSCKYIQLYLINIILRQCYNCRRKIKFY